MPNLNDQMARRIASARMERGASASPQTLLDTTWLFERRVPLQERVADVLALSNRLQGVSLARYSDDQALRPFARELQQAIRELESLVRAMSRRVDRLA